MGRVVYKDESGREHSVAVGPDKPIVTIGRATDCTIRSSKKSVSRRHAELRYEGGSCKLVDLDSSNGTYIIMNGERQPVLSAQSLSHNDEVWCGDFILYYYESDERGQRRSAQPSRSQSSLQSGQHVPQVKSTPGGPTEDFEEIEPEVIGEIDEEPFEELERLREEKKSVEDLASRQAVQIQEMQDKITELEQGGADSAQLEEAHARIEELETQRDQAERDVDRMERKVGDLEQEIQERQAKLDDALDRNDELRDEVESLRETSGNVDTLRQDLQDRAREVDSLEREIEHLERQLERAQADAERAESASQEVEELEDELDRRRRLIEELEQENRELRDDLQERDQDVDDLETSLDRARGRVEDFRDERDEMQKRLEELSGDFESVDSRIESIQRTAEERADEIQGLKQRLSLKREQKRDAELEVEKLREKNEQLASQVEALSAEEDVDLDELTEVGSNGVQVEGLAEIRDRIERLRRLVDAIERTDLDPLSTVDRIRLQSAIRETAPEESLETLLELIETDANPQDEAE